jgi:thiamine biosynthesis lipoprotein
MASPLVLTIDPAAAATAASAWAAVVDEFEASEAAMSRFRETSDLTIASRAVLHGGSALVDGRLRQALVVADRARRMTDGRFDVRVLGDLDRLGYRGVDLAPEQGGSTSAVPAPRAVGVGAISGREPTRGRAPRAPAGASAADRDRSTMLELGDDRSLRLLTPVDLGGIGKGLALRWAAARIRRILDDRAGALLEAGGDIVALGSAPGGEPWFVAIEDPNGRPDGLAVVGLRDEAVATSSVAVHAWVAPDGTPVHHLLDPASGEPGGGGLRAVTVVGPDPAWAEVRTKQLFLAGPNGIGPLARALGLAAWWVDATGALEMTPAARQQTAWVGSEGPAPVA